MRAYQPGVGMRGRGWSGTFWGPAARCPPLQRWEAHAPSLQLPGALWLGPPQEAAQCSALAQPVAEALAPHGHHAGGRETWNPGPESAPFLHPARSLTRLVVESYSRTECKLYALRLISDHCSAVSCYALCWAQHCAALLVIANRMSAALPLDDWPIAYPSRAHQY